MFPDCNMTINSCNRTVIVVASMVLLQSATNFLEFRGLVSKREQSWAGGIFEVFKMIFRTFHQVNGLGWVWAFQIRRMQKQVINDKNKWKKFQKYRKWSESSENNFHKELTLTSLTH